MQLRMPGDKNWIALHWKLQGLGLILITLLSFNPKLFHLEEYLFFFLLLTSLGVSVFQGVPFWVRSPIDLPLALLVGWILLTIPFSIDPSYSFSEWKKVAGRILVFYWAMLVLARQIERDFCRRMIHIVVFGALILSFMGIADFIVMGGTLVTRGARRASTFDGHSHWLATYLIMAVPFVVFLYMQAKSSWQRFGYGFAALVIGIAEFLTYSRGGWLALGLQGIGFGVLSRKRRVLVMSVLWSVGALGVIFAVSQLGYLAGIFDNQSVADRLGCWGIGVQEIARHPLVGVGFGNDIFLRLYPGDPPGDCTGGHLHNTLLMFGMGSGVPGLLLLLWVFFELIGKFSSDVKNSLNSEVGALRVAMVVMVLGYVVSMTFNYLFTGSLAYLFWILVASGFSFRSRNETAPFGKIKS